MRAAGYVRVSTAEQGDSGAGLAAQREAIQRWADYRRAELVLVEEDVASGKTTNGRHGLERAIATCERGEADALVVAKLDRLSRSIVDFAKLVERSRANDWAIVVLDPEIDLTTATGRMIGNVLSSLSQWEREIIGERTKAALAALKAADVRLGRPPGLTTKVRTRIVRERKDGKTYRAIAEGLNKDGVPTAQGGAAWHATTVRKVVLAAERDAARQGEVQS
jgi:DNA invertase Pin-like site-specific DNA recombinase